ncbi:hypothetical protein E1218_19675 [Kribbella turkmenica]|uniref:Uncharacterized protein n=1 Tax=Kribbella turkmenica TaxID=2530375 RepID=A0A4R4WWP3_9ACTN|nr:hypothetical protein [Kribbella turkmenica]TDD22176.1 hypothetical protein E1218_19675 [Kribbella turkmenica]
MTIGGVDTYYDYDEKQWKSRRLGGGPIRQGPVCPTPSEQPGAEPVARVRTSRPKKTADRVKA